jgi:hypothetical protein
VYKSSKHSLQILQLQPSISANPCVPYMPHPSHSPWFDHPSNMWGVYNTGLLIMQYSPIYCYFLSFSSKYLFQHPVL